MRSARNAIGLVFFVNGVTFASWSPRLPEIQDRLGVSDTALGLTLVGAGVGGLAASVVSGKLVDRFGSRAMTVVTSAALSLCLPLMGVAPRAVLLFASLVVLGSLDGLTDVSMNAQAVELQRRRGTSIISRFHALWSVGAVTGGILASRAAQIGLELWIQLILTSVVLIVMTVVAGRWLLPSRRSPTPSPVAPADATTAASPPERRWPRAILVRLFLVGLAVALAEAPPNEWAALMVDDRFDVGPGAAGLGFVAVAGGMLIGRLVGDHVTDRLGPELTRRGGAALAAVGVVIATLAPQALVSGAGLFVTGLGLSSLFPLLFRAASEMTHGSHSGMAAFSSGARLGFLVASPAIGLIAGGTSIATAVLIVAGGAAIAVAASHLPVRAERELVVTPPA
jgi:MFS family permease